MFRSKNIKIIVIFLGLFIFVGFDCDNHTFTNFSQTFSTSTSGTDSSRIISKKTESISNEQKVVSITQAEQKQKIDFYTTNYFNQKLIPFNFYDDVINKSTIGYVFQTYSKNDCLGLLHGKNIGGDLLTTLGKDKVIYNLVKEVQINKGSTKTTQFKKYTPEYLLEFYDKINSFTRQKYNKDFFAFYACQLSPDVNIVAGNIWDSKNSPYYFNDQLKYVDVSSDFENSTSLLLLYKNKIIEFKNVNPMPNSQPGGGSYPCESGLKKDYIEWSCFDGFAECGALYKNTHLYFDGTTTISSSCEKG